MAHPKMFDDDDPHLARVRELAHDLPGADEKVSHGRPCFFTKKVFCYYGGSIKVDDTWVQHPQAVIVRPDDDEREALLQDDRVFLPAYLSPSGWIGVDLGDDTDWDEIGELLADSFRSTAPAKNIRELDDTAERQSDGD